MIDIEHELSEHLHRRAERTRLRFELQDLEPLQRTSGQAPPGGRSRRLRLVLVGVTIVLVAVGAVALVEQIADPAVEVATAPVGTTPPTTGEQGSADAVGSSARLNAEGDQPIDPGGLRYAEPLPDDVVAFLNAPDSLRPPRESDDWVPVDDGHAVVADNLGFVAMDGPRLLMSGAIVEIGPEVTAEQVSGAAADIGVDGARYTDADEGAIAIPTGDAFRIVGPRDYFAFGGGSHVDPDVLSEIARVIGTTPLEDLDTLPGIVVYSGTLDGAAIDFVGARRATAIRHGESLGEPTVSLLRLAEPPTALELIAISHVFAQDRDDTPTIGQVVFAGERTYLELVSPIDLLVVSSIPDRGDIPALVDFAPLEELDTAFDGSVDAPPAPTPVRPASDTEE